MFVIVVHTSPDPDENFAIGPFETADEAYQFHDDWAQSGDQTAGYAEVWSLNVPDLAAFNEEM